MSRTIGVQLTTRCNLQCVHCYVNAPSNDLSVATFTRIAQQACDADCACMDFTGGEPTCHPQLSEILRTLCVHDLSCTFVTNGWSFPETFPLLASYQRQVRHVSFSLENASADLHDQCRGQGSFDRVLHAAELCAQANMPFGFRMTVTRANLDALPAMLALAEARGASALALIPLMPTPRTSLNGWMLSPEDMQRLLKETLRLRAQAAHPVILSAGCFSTDPLKPCPAFAGQSLFITARGDVSCCCQLADHACGRRTDIVGNLAHMSLRDAAARVQETLQAMAREKRRRLDSGALGYLDHHPCWYCLKRFGKVDWMRSLPENPWTRDMQAHDVARVPAESAP